MWQGDKCLAFLREEMVFSFHNYSVALGDELIKIVLNPQFFWGGEGNHM